MKKSIRTALALAMMFVLVLSMTTGIYADETPTITFKGFGKSAGFDFQPGTVYHSTDLFQGFKNVVPGDTLSQRIIFKNEAADTDYVVLSMRAELHDEQTNPPQTKDAQDVAWMNEFLSKLSMKVTAGSQVVFDASPDQLGGLKNFVRLGAVSSGKTLDLNVELTVPLDLDNAYADRIGEVDWVFHVDGYNVTHLTVRKVWNDGGLPVDHSNDVVMIDLLADGQSYLPARLTADTNWTHDFYNLDTDFEWSVVETNVPEGYDVSYEVTDTEVTIINTRKDLTSLTVEKQWVNGANAQPESATVELLANGQTVESVILSAQNSWQHTWNDLAKDIAWSVRETNVPEGYRPVYQTEGTKTVIQNVYKTEPIDQKTSLTVEKVWAGEQPHPDAVTAVLLANGEARETVTLSAENNWQHTWTALDASVNWSAVEQDVPAGYKATYETNGQTVTITNTPVSTEPAALTVKKVWSGDKGIKRPEAVTATLYNGTEKVESVLLNAANGWTYTWENLDPSGSWQVVETNIPKEYTPSYKVENGVVTITNTATLIHTGQLKWPVPVLGGLGLILAALGCVVIFRKKKGKDA